MMDGAHQWKRTGTRSGAFKQATALLPALRVFVHATGVAGVVCALDPTGSPASILQLTGLTDRPLFIDKAITVIVRPVAELEVPRRCTAVPIVAVVRKGRTVSIPVDGNEAARAYTRH